MAITYPKMDRPQAHTARNSHAGYYPLSCLGDVVNASASGYRHSPNDGKVGAHTVDPKRATGDRGSPHLICGNRWCRNENHCVPTTADRWTTCLIHDHGAEVSISGAYAWNYWGQTFFAQGTDAPELLVRTNHGRKLSCF